ncbi:hypothetical protein, partial [Pseudomonas serboccidentalis]|uniref:hypothetical protein n=1 Tax=Pseudomonas serboccidentalis TaxID=2964670 RepID=UPI0039E1B9E9
VRYAALHVVDDFDGFKALDVGASAQRAGFVLKNVSGAVIQGGQHLELGVGTQDKSVVSFDLKALASNVSFSLGDVDTAENLVRLY